MAYRAFVPGFVILLATACSAPPDPPSISSQSALGSSCSGGPGAGGSNADSGAPGTWAGNITSFVACPLETPTGQVDPACSAGDYLVTCANTTTELASSPTQISPSTMCLAYEPPPPPTATTFPYFCEYYRSTPYPSDPGAAVLEEIIVEAAGVGDAKLEAAASCASEFFAGVAVNSTDCNVRGCWGTELSGYPGAPCVDSTDCEAECNVAAGACTCGGTTQSPGCNGGW